MKSYSIVPRNYEVGIPQLKKYGLILLAFPISLLVLYAIHLIPLVGCVVCSLPFSIIITYILGHALRYERIATSYVIFGQTKVEICDKQSAVWRSIAYDDITEVRICEIEGFMDGYHGVSGIAEYIVIFTNNCTEVPISSYYQKFTNPNFFPIYFRKDVMDELSLHMMCRFTSDMVWNPDS